MEDTRLLKMVFNAKPEGRRGVERPRLRWLDDVADINALGVRRWRIKAQDRKEWPAILRELKSCLTTRHEGAWGREDIAPTHYRPRH
jgi:hypothetical protein